MLSQVRKNGTPRVAWITNLMAHYRLPSFRALSNLMPGRVTFFMLAEQAAQRNYILTEAENGLPIVYLRGWTWRRPRKLFLHSYDDLHLNDIRPILAGKYDIHILCGWDEPTYLLLWAWATATRKTILFGCESTAYDSVRFRLAEGYKRLMLRKAKGCVVVGHRARQYCQSLGMEASRTFVAPNAADRQYYRSMAEQLRPMREVLRQERGLHGMVILFVGRLEEEHKGVLTLIDACSILEQQKISFSLVLAGDGPDRKRYEEVARTKGLHSIRFVGMLNREELCRYYAMADVLVLPSRSEPWGFVLNEAMEFGLPLIVSEAVGAGPDLVIPKTNGFVFPVGDTEALGDALRRLEGDENLRLAMGEHSRTLIEKFSPESWAEGIVKAIEAVGCSGRPHSPK